MTRKPIESALRTDPKVCLNGHDLTEFGVRRAGRKTKACIQCERDRTARSRGY